MIAPQELRIGNFIRDIESEREGYVLTIGKRASTVKMEFSELTQKYEEYEPIELTEDWLLKLGFEKTNGLWSKESFPAYFTKFTNGSGLYEFFVGRISIVKIKYIHQLQNLYFDFTGEELTIKE